MAPLLEKTFKSAVNIYLIWENNLKSRAVKCGPSDFLLIDFLLVSVDLLHRSQKLFQNSMKDLQVTVRMISKHDTLKLLKEFCNICDKGFTIYML